MNCSATSCASCLPKVSRTRCSIMSSAAVPPQQVRPDALQQTVLALRGDWK